MKQKTCYYCGTVYDPNEDRCPLCGQTEVEPEAIDEPVTPYAAPVVEEEDPFRDDDDDDYIPRRRRRGNGLSSLICVLLTVAVIAGALFVLNSIGIVKFGPAATNPPVLDLPVESDPVEPDPENVLCTNIVLEPSYLSLTEAGQTSALHVAVLPANCTETITYSSSDETVATVSADGTVTAVASGTAEITASCGSFATTMVVVCDIIEIPPEIHVDPDSVSLSTVDFTLFSQGETAQIKVRGLPEGVEVLWESKNVDVCTVENGKVTGVGGGTTIVTATMGDVTLECYVRCRFTVEKAPENNGTGDADPGTDPEVIPSNPDQAEELPFLSHEDVTVVPGESFVIRLVQNNARVKGVTWTSTDTEVVIVADDGTVTAVTPGLAKIIGTYDGVEYSCIVRCH